LLHPVLLLLLAFTAPAVSNGSSSSPARKPHSEYFEHYEGTKTCLSCHEKEAQPFFHSQHYQWRAQAPALVNSKGRLIGKMNTLNDCRTAPATNWIGAVQQSLGEVITNGCSA